ncbi:Smc5-6 complex non-SMC subunit Nse4 [Suillus cothurnatus]|nr:Smc5-6 complex non-SMC subunit Nse4 [Suillus cothurnatus]
MDDKPNVITAENFIDKLACFLERNKSGREDIDGPPLFSTHAWEAVGLRALAKSKRVPVQDFMSGPLGHASTRSEVSDKDGDSRNDAEHVDHNDEGRIHNQMTDILGAAGPLNLFRFIVNPESFGQSVENLYLLSLLFHRGLCGLRMADNGEPLVWMCDSLGDYPNAEAGSSHQMVMEFDMTTWKVTLQSDLLDLSLNVWFTARYTGL